MDSGRYDDLAEQIYQSEHADGVILAVRNGRRGTGLSVTGPLEFQRQLPNLLRVLAAQIEQTFKEKPE